jgi:hypothetical protein
VRRERLLASASAVARTSFTRLALRDIFRQVLTTTGDGNPDRARTQVFRQFSDGFEKSGERMSTTVGMYLTEPGTAAMAGNNLDPHGAQIDAQEATVVLTFPARIDSAEQPTRHGTHLTGRSRKSKSSTLF